MLCYTPLSVNVTKWAALAPIGRGLAGGGAGSGYGVGSPE